MKEQIEKQAIEDMALDLFRIDTCKHLSQEECNETNCAYCEAEALYNAGYRKQEWISVDERLPEEYTHIIVCDEDGTVGEALCYKKGRFEWIDSEEIAFVTHWMPLPEPPKMKGGAE